MTRVSAKFVFELPFHVEIQGQCSGAPQCLKRDSEKIIVYPPALNSPFSDKPPWSPDLEQQRGSIHGQPVWRARYIIIDIIRDFPAIPITGESQKALVTRAKEILHGLLILYRARGKQLQIDVRGIDKFDYRIGYYNAAGSPLDASPGGRQRVGEIHSTAVLPSLINYDWKAVCQDLISGATPELYESLLLDARSVVSQEPRRAVIDAATACEVFIKNFCDTASENNPEIYPYVYSALTQRGGLLYYFHEVLKYLFRHSLNEDKPHLYEELGYLVNTNNNVKHKGQCYYTINKKNKGVDIQVNSTKARDFINTVEEAIQYTKSLGC